VFLENVSLKKKHSVNKGVIMNIINKLLLLLSLSMTPAVAVSAQEVNNEFDTYQTVDKYLADFDYLTENTFRLSEVTWENAYYTQYEDTYNNFYVFPKYYEIDFDPIFIVYYSNDSYNFYHLPGSETITEIIVINYVGEESKMPFLALDYIGMNQVIEHDKAEKSNSISIYNSFYKFFTGFFPENVVNEYHGIFTFIVVGFLLFLVFGFVFFLFRVIRRLVGFK
jgi:hypothetical protein